METFTSVLSQYTSLQELALCETILSPVVLPTWTSLLSLRSLRLVDVLVANSPATGTELQFISQLTNLTTLVIAISEEQQMGGILSSVSQLTNLQSLGITCFHADHFAAVARLPLLSSLTADFCNESAEFECLQSFPEMTRVRHVRLKAKKQIRDASFGQELSNSKHTSDYCTLQLHVTAANEGTAMEAVGKMTRVRHMLIQDIRDPCNIRFLNGLPSHCCLWLGCAVGNELLKQVACLRSLTRLFIHKYSGDVSGMLWLKHMPNLKLLEFGKAVDSAILRVLPKRLLKTRRHMHKEAD